MKKTLMLIVFVSAGILSAQEHFCAKVKKTSMASQINQQARSTSLNPQISHELEYDVKFVHLDLQLERTNKNINGNVKTVATVAAATLDTFMTLLHQNHTIDSMWFNGIHVTSIRQDSILKAKTPVQLTTGSSFTVMVYYHGTAPTGGSAIGSGMSNASSPSWGNQVTWSLSESLAAYHWWPCKQILTDKIDSSWVSVTTDSANVVGSNGRLQHVSLTGSKKRYDWKSHAPIDYYLISVSVAKYKEYNLYAKPMYLPNDSILIQNYIYDGAINNPSWTGNQKLVLNKMPQVLEFECKMYGMYPFYKEKYGHCMAPLSGGMEHQTMTTLGFFDYYTDAHELGHHWWGDNVTCKSWGDIWMNEGFAAYTEHLVAEHLDPLNFMPNLNTAHQSVMSQPGGSIFFTNHDTVDANRIFDSRLTYDKGGSIIRSLQFLTNNDSLWFNTLRSFQNSYKRNVASVIDFKNYYQAQTVINPTQFFNQWYYGEGYPTFAVKYNYDGTNCFIQSSETVSMPTVTPLFLTPVEYKISRTGFADTTVRLIQNIAVENYSFSLTGTITNVACDPNNWIINKVTGPVRDAALGVSTPTLPQNTDGITEIELKFSGITIGPNPTKGIVLINNSLNAKGFVQVLGLAGKLILEKNLGTKTDIDLSSCPAGVYMIKISDGDKRERFSRKIIKN